MALGDYKAPSREFTIGDTTFKVRGVSLYILTAILQNHIEDLEAIFDLIEDVQTGESSVTDTDLQKILVRVAQEMPGLTANLIAHAAGEVSPAAIEAANDLPFTFQLDVLFAISELTFSEVGGVKKAFTTIKDLIAAGRKLR